MNYNFKTYFLMLAHYNQWANTKLFAILGTLTEEQLNQDCHAYFKSLIQTANHVLIGDMLWFERISGLASSNLALDTILYPNIVQLTQARVAFAIHWIRSRLSLGSSVLPLGGAIGMQARNNHACKGIYRRFCA